MNVGEVLDLLELEFQVSHLMWVLLGTEFGFFGRTARALNYQVISLAPQERKEDILFVFLDSVSPGNSYWPNNCYVEQVDLEFRKIHLSLHLEYWD